MACAWINTEGSSAARASLVIRPNYSDPQPRMVVPVVVVVKEKQHKINDRRPNSVERVAGFLNRYIVHHSSEGANLSSPFKYIRSCLCVDVGI